MNLSVMHMQYIIAEKGKRRKMGEAVKCLQFWGESQEFEETFCLCILF